MSHWTATATTTRQPPVVAATSTAKLSTTHAELRRWRFGLVAGTVVVLACAFLAFEGAFLTIDAVTGRGLPAVVYSLNAARAVVSANSAVATNFATPDDIALTGAGRDYQADLDLATQSLEQVAGVNEAGTTGSQAVESVDGQLATYLELVEQADAYYARGEPTVGAAEAWHAAQLMESGGVLDDLKTLRTAELTTVDARGSSFWTGWVAVLLWVGPAVALLVALVLAQLYLARRFNRTYNWPLVAASVLLFALAAGSVLLIVSDQRFASAQAELHSVVDKRTATTTAIDAEGKASMVALVGKQCGSTVSCGPTIASAGKSTTAQSTVDNSAADLASATTELASADATYGLPYVIPVLAVAVAALVLIGLQPRINEYRYQP